MPLELENAAIDDLEAISSLRLEPWRTARGSFSMLYAWVVVGNGLGELFFQGMDFIEEPHTEKDFPFKGTVWGIR